MRLCNLILTAAASLSIAVGATYQGTRADDSYAHRLFAKAQADDFLGSKACAECHKDKVANFAHSGHAAFVNDPSLPPDKKGCEGCHGPGNFHLKDENAEIISFTKLSPKESSAACLRCHQDVMTSSQWHRTTHSKADLACVACHQIHPEEEAPTMQTGKRDLLKNDVYPASKISRPLLKADQAKLCATCHQKEAMQFRKSSHHPLPEGKMVCTDCHSLHPTKADLKDIAASSVKNSTSAPIGRRMGLTKQNCVTCHANKAGPFVFEHDPVAGHTGEGCAECHDPHGSHNPQLLNAFSRGLCAKCHTEKLATHFPGRTCWSSGCHQAVHGSNSSSKLLRK